MSEQVQEIAVSGAGRRGKNCPFAKREPTFRGSLLVYFRRLNMKERIIRNAIQSTESVTEGSNIRSLLAGYSTTENPEKC